MPSGASPVEVDYAEAICKPLMGRRPVPGDYVCILPLSVAVPRGTEEGVLSWHAQDL